MMVTNTQILWLQAAHIFHSTFHMDVFLHYSAPEFRKYDLSSYFKLQARPSLLLYVLLILATTFSPRRIVLLMLRYFPGIFLQKLLSIFLSN